LNKTLPYTVGILVYFVLFLLFILSSGLTLTTQFLKYRSLKVYETSFEYYSLSVNVHELTFHRKVSRYQRVINGTKNNKMEKKKKKDKKTKNDLPNTTKKPKDCPTRTHQNKTQEPPKKPTNKTGKLRCSGRMGSSCSSSSTRLVTLVCSCHYKQSNTKIPKMLLVW
jgi:hypothetical protein